MRIGIDARFYSQSGIGRYLRNLILNLQKLDKDNQYFILLLKDDFLKFEETSNFKKVEADIPWYGLSEQLQFPKILRRYKLDLVHFPHFNIPVLYKGKFVVTIHDLIHQKYQMKTATTKSSLVYFVKHLAYNFVFSIAIKKSKKIIVPSEYVKKDLMKSFKVGEERVIITNEGVEEKFIKDANKISKEKQKEILNKFNIKPPFIFYTGNAHPHKNIPGLMEAFKVLRKDYQYLTLVLAGNDNYFWQKVREDFNVRDVIYTDRLKEEELAVLYKNASCYIQPSFEEGFGLPLLEAFALDCPVASSNAASLPEVGGGAVLYFNPFDIYDIAEKLKRVLNEQKLRKELIEKGKERVKMFDFKKMAQETLELYKGVI
jgi:glycosyltransferase involved in cell wall biosynthesis